MTTANKLNNISFLNDKKNPITYNKKAVKNNYTQNNIKYSLHNQVDQEYISSEKISTKYKINEKNKNNSLENLRNSDKNNSLNENDMGYEYRPLAIKNISEYINTISSNLKTLSCDKNSVKSNIHISNNYIENLKQIPNSNVIQIIKKNKTNNNLNDQEFINNIGIKTKEYFLNEKDLEILNNQQNNRKYVNSKYDIYSKNTKNKKNEKFHNNNLNYISDINNIGDNFKSLSKNSKPHENTYISTVREYKMKSNNNITENVLNEKINYLVDKINLRKIKDNEGKISKNSNKKSNKIISYNKKQNNISWDVSKKISHNKKLSSDNLTCESLMEISPHSRSREISNVISELNTKNQVLTSQLHGFQEKYLNIDEKLNNLKIKKGKEKNNSKDSNNSLFTESHSRENKKSLDVFCSTKNISSHNKHFKNLQNINSFVKIVNVTDKTNYNCDSAKKFEPINKTIKVNKYLDENILSERSTPLRSPTPSTKSVNLKKNLSNKNILSKKDIQKNNYTNRIQSLNIDVSPREQFQEKIIEKDYQIEELEHKLIKLNSNFVVKEKNTKYSEKKIETLQNILTDNLIKLKNDDKTKESLKDEIFTDKKTKNTNSINSSLTYEGNENFFLGNPHTIKFDIEKDEWIIHKIYSNHIEKKNFNNENFFYFVLISDSSQNNFFWVDLIQNFINFETDRNNRNNDILNNQRTLVNENNFCDLNFENKFLKKNFHNKFDIILEAINFFELNIKSMKINNINSYTSSINNNQMAKIIKGIKYKNFSSAKLPIQNLYLIETDIKNIYNQYINFESEFKSTKNFLIDEIKKKDDVIKNLKINLEKLIEDNTLFFKNMEKINIDNQEKEKKNYQDSEIIKEKNIKIESLNNILALINSNNSKNLDYIMTVEEKMNQLNLIISNKDVEIKNLLKRISKDDNSRVLQEKNFLILQKQNEENKKNLNEKEELIDKFNVKLEELENKYKNNFLKLEKSEKVDNLHLNLEERKKLNSKIQELEILKNSLLEKISNLEFINKNFENEKNEQENLLEEKSNIINELNIFIIQLKSDRKELTQKLDFLNSKIYEMNNSIEEEKNKYNLKQSQNHELTKKINYYSEELNKMNNNLENKNKLISHYENDLEKLTNTIKELNNNYEKRNEVNKNNKTNENINLTNKPDIIILQNEKNSLIESNKKLTRELEKNKYTTDRLLREKENKISELVKNYSEENLELEKIISDFYNQADSAEKNRVTFFEYTNKIKQLNLVLLFQEERIKKLQIENDNLTLDLETEVKKKCITSQGENENEFINNTNTRIIEIQSMNIELEMKSREKILKIEILEKEKNNFLLEIKELNSINEKNLILINEKNKKTIQDEQVIKDLTEKINNLEIEIKKFKNEQFNFNYNTNICNNKINYENSIIISHDLKELNNINEIKKKIFELEYINNNLHEENKNIKNELENINNKLSEENNHLKNELEKMLNKQNNLKKFHDEESKNLLAKMEKISELQELNKKLKEENEQHNLNSKKSEEFKIIYFQLKEENEILKNEVEKISKLEIINKKVHQENEKLKKELENMRIAHDRIAEEITEYNILKLGASFAKDDNLNSNNNNISNLNYSSSMLDLQSDNKDKEFDKLKILDYEDKLEKLIISNSEIQKKNNSLMIEIKQLQEKIYALENFDDGNNRNLGKLKKSENHNEVNTLKSEIERLQELNKDYENSISHMQNKLEFNNNDKNKLREDYEGEINILKIKILEYQKLENLIQKLKEKIAENENEKNQFDEKFFSQIKKLNSEIKKKNERIEVLTNELSESYILIGESKRRMELYSDDLIKNKSIEKNNL